MYWKTVGVLGKPNFASTNLDTFKALFDLLTECQIKALFEHEVGKILNLDPASCLDAETLIRNSDLILVVGGDGSMLKASKLAVEHQKPLLGVNRGHLGFLTDIGPKELSERLLTVLKGNFWIENRSVLSGHIQASTRQKTHHNIALNDVVLSPGASTQLLEFDLWLNDQFVCRQRADGVIVTTPTGSTAYALSAGGPILHPQLNAVAIVPMLPHKLTSRPLVVSTNSTIKIILQQQRDAQALVSFDSQERYPIEAATTIKIQHYHKSLQLVHPNDYDYFQTLRDKLGWESH